MTEEWAKIKEALENPKFKWRTIEGITKDTGIDKALVVGIISKHEDDIVKSSIPSKMGEGLFTTRNRYKELATPWQKIKSAIRNQVE
jgi:hypothetical protein